MMRPFPMTVLHEMGVYVCPGCGIAAVLPAALGPPPLCSHCGREDELSLIHRGDVVTPVLTIVAEEPKVFGWFTARRMLYIAIGLLIGGLIGNVVGLIVR